MRKIASTWIFLLFMMLFWGFSVQPAKAVVSAIDVVSYKIALNLSNPQEVIEGEATILFKAMSNGQSVVFDFDSKNEDNTGMEVLKVSCGFPVKDWKHIDDEIIINFSSAMETAQAYELIIKYKGKPADGLIISKNSFGDLTVFGDNWPNRAHYWFPCIDHPADKALVTFDVKHPSQYKVVSNGELVLHKELANGISRTKYHSHVPLPTKVMVVGMANFAVSDSCMANEVPVTSWVYKQQHTEGFADYAVACEVLKWFSHKIAPYPYEKLANVQSKTRYGGMENAGCIFYFEGSVDGEKQVEDLIAHEIAHQWFGNSASEADWSHLWLSEGFATYLTDLYVLDQFGKEAYNKRMQEERQKALNFNKKVSLPLVDTLSTNINSMLNPNAYEKGAWVLHMLRNELGDSVFWQCIKQYYTRYQLGNAYSRNFVHVVNEVSGRDMRPFFEQWLRRAGHPKLKIVSKPSKAPNKLTLKVVQEQKELYTFNLQIRIKGEDGVRMFDLPVNSKRTTFNLSSELMIDSWEIDPDALLFFSYQLIEK
ncbi:M1 family peptidase [bacterium]|nr:M1 family peptidase [bacterium]